MREKRAFRLPYCNRDYIFDYYNISIIRMQKNKNIFQNVIIMFLYRVSDESGTLEMTAIDEIPLKKEHLDSYVSLKGTKWIPRIMISLF